MKRMYFDNNATTPLAKEVLEILCQSFSEIPANPSSTHFFGREAKAKLLSARETIARFFQVKPSELIFTSGGTESVNLLIKGTAQPLSIGSIITSNIEHACVEKTLTSLEKNGWQIKRLRASSAGNIEYSQVEQAIDTTTKMIVLGSANSETGVKAPIKEVGKLAKQHNIPFIVDGIGSFGKEIFTFPDGVTGIALSSHKIHGPKGVGLVLLRPFHKITALLDGGGQESGRRSGTENLEGILGLSKAISLLEDTLSPSIAHMTYLRDLFENTLVQNKLALVNGAAPRTANTSNLAFPGIDGETLLMCLDLEGIAASHGSACAAGALEPSRVLQNMGLPLPLVRSSIRFSFSRYTTEEEIRKALEIIERIIHKLK